MILCISVLSVVIFSFSFLILLIWFFFCFLMSQANGLSILFIFSKNQLLALLIFAMIFFVSFAFISALIFKISFLLLTLGFFISSFSSSFRCRVRLCSWLFFLFLEVSLYWYEPSPLHCFTVSHRVWPPHVKNWLIGKDSDDERDWGQEEKGTTEDEMAVWHHWLDGCESKWTPGVGDRQGGLACSDSWVAKSQTRLSDWTETEQASKK